MSRIVPNSYQTPNLHTDRLMHYLTGDEWKTLHYALRRTFGWNRERDRISISQFRNGNGRLDEAGNPVEYGTGLSQSAQVEAIRELMRFGILIEVAPNNAQKQGRLWALQLDESQVRFDLLRERQEAQRDAHRRKTARARQAAVVSRAAQGEAPLAAVPVDNFTGLTDRPMTPVCGTDRYRSEGQTDTGLKDRPTPVCGTDTQKHSLKPTRNPLETHSEGVAAGGAVPSDVASAKGAGGAGIMAAWRELVALCDGDEARAMHVWRLQERFAAVTKLRRPDPQTEAGRARLRRDWWPNLLLVLAESDGDMAEAEAGMQEGIETMLNRPDPLNIVSPKSIVNVTSGVLARRRRGETFRPAPKSPGQPKGFAGIDAYLERRGGARGN